MNKVKLLSVVAFGLLISNLALVGFIVCNNSSHGKMAGPRNIVIEKLNFDVQQVKEYDKLIDAHQLNIIKSEQKIMQLKNKLYRNLTNDKGNVKDSLINELVLVQENIENTHYAHFEDIKKLCKAEQQQAYEGLTSEIAALFAGPKMKRRLK